MKNPITSCEETKRLLAAALRRIPDITSNGVSRARGAVNFEQPLVSVDFAWEFLRTRYANGGER